MVQVQFAYILQTLCLTLASCLPFRAAVRYLFRAFQINVSGTQEEEAWVQSLVQVECLLCLLPAMQQCVSQLCH